jgi:DNA-directed RNA polymerase sigma subunit (sigma70/sigma32)
MLTSWPESSVDDHLLDIQGVPLLTAEEERELAARMKKHRSAIVEERRAALEAANALSAPT